MNTIITNIKQQIIEAINDGNWEKATELSKMENRFREFANQRCLQEIAKGNWDTAAEYHI